MLTCLRQGSFNPHPFQCLQQLVGGGGGGIIEESYNRFQVIRPTFISMFHSYLSSGNLQQCVNEVFGRHSYTEISHDTVDITKGKMNQFEEFFPELFMYQIDRMRSCRRKALNFIIFFCNILIPLLPKISVSLLGNLSITFLWQKSR